MINIYIYTELDSIQVYMYRGQNNHQYKYTK